MAAPRVTVIVLNWNGLEQTRACLASLRALDYPAVTLHVVDNGSTDGSVAALAAEFPDVLQTRHAVNLGYTGGNNPAIRAAVAAGADYVWLFNSDATTAPDTLARLVAQAEADPGIGMISPLIGRAGTPTCDFTGGLLDLDIGSYHVTEDLAEGAAWQQRHPDRFVLTGTTLLLRRALIERIGVFDDRFFAYWEDTDYGLRSLRAGFRNHLAFEVQIAHAPKPLAATGQGKPHFYYLMTRNEILFWRKHMRARALRPVLWTLRRQGRLATANRDRRATADSIMAGLWDGLLGRGGAYDPARRMPAPVQAAVRALG